MFILLAVIGVPGTASFIANLSIILGVIEHSFLTLITVFALFMFMGNRHGTLSYTLLDRSLILPKHQLYVHHSAHPPVFLT